MNIHATRGLAVRELPLPVCSFGDQRIKIDVKAAGIVEATKKKGTPLSGAEFEGDRNTKTPPKELISWRNSLPCAPQSTCIEASFVDGLDSVPRELRSSPIEALSAVSNPVNPGD